MDATQTGSDSDPSETHRIPVIDKMMELLEVLERRPSGPTIRELVSTSGQPRTTVYRILNTLQRHGVVRRSDAGAYTLGPRLLSLSSRVVDEADYYLAAIAQPYLEKLSHDTGESSKVSVLSNFKTLVLVSAQGKREYALIVKPGQALPLHAGAGSKILLANAPDAEREAVLRGTLEAFTARTFSDPKRLRAELAKINRQGWAADKGEFSPNVNAFGAPVRDSAGRCVGALSVPFLAGANPDRLEHIRRSAIATAMDIGAALPVDAKAAGRR